MRRWPLHGVSYLFVFRFFLFVREEFNRLGSINSPSNARVRPVEGHDQDGLGCFELSLECGNPNTRLSVLQVRGDSCGCAALPPPHFPYLQCFVREFDCYACCAHRCAIITMKRSVQQTPSARVFSGAVLTSRRCLLHGAFHMFHPLRRSYCGLSVGDKTTSPIETAVRAGANSSKVRARAVLST